MNIVDHLEQLATAGRFAIYTDIDGTLSPIAETPAAAYLYPGAADELLALGSHGIRIVAISGRSASDARRLVGIESIDYAGNHGFELLSSVGQHASDEVIASSAAVRRALDDVAEVMQHLPEGILIEDKTFTGSIHFRAADDPQQAARILRPLLESIGIRHGLRITEGRMVYELRPRLDINKGVFTERDIRSHGIETAAFLGDDMTDLDGFRALRRLVSSGELLGAICVGVRAPESPQEVLDASDYLVDGVAGMVAALHQLNLRLGARSGL